MKEFIDKLILRTSKYVPYPKKGQLEGIDYWRNRFLYLLILSLILLGFIAYLPSMYLSIADEVWSIAVIDTIALLLIVILGFSRGLSARAKTNLILATVYMLGVLLLTILGPVGAGFIWLFFFPVLAALLLSFRAVIICTAILIVTFIIMSFPIIMEIPGNYHLLLYTPSTWLVNVVNFLTVNFLVSASTSIILSKMDQSIMSEKQISEILKTEQEKLKIEKEKAQEADRLKTAFLANMSHEIRTPMNGIMGFMELLKNPNLEETRKEKYISIIHKSGNRMLDIINDLIYISKIEANQMEVSMGETDLENLIVEVYNLFKPLTDKKGLNFRHELDLQTSSGLVVSDRKKIIQVLSNLIQNSIKFTREGEIKIVCKAMNGHYEFSVHDTGIGISPERQDKIFDRFHHTETESDKLQQGAGLGLAISKAFVELLGGQIWFESIHEKGTTFYFKIPKDNKQV